MTTCAATNCDREGKLTRGLCPKHYMRLRREGTIEDGAGRRRQAAASAQHSNHPMYPAWQQMILRCHDPKNSIYPRYGARGVVVCDRWRQNFQNYLADMGERPEGMTLDRIDPRGPYSPENCRWATAKEQRANRDPEYGAAADAAFGRRISEYWAKWNRERVCTPPGEIRATRLDLGLTQRAFARLVGLTGANAEDTVASWESGRHPISKRVQERLEAITTNQREASK